MKRLEGKVAIVTGANSGICRAIAIAYGQEGAKVVCVSRSEFPHEGGFEEQKSKSTAQVIVGNDGEAVFYSCDMSDHAAVEKLVAWTVEKYGRLDIIVNGAGIFRGLSRIDEMPDDWYDSVMAVNAGACWNGCKYAIKQFLKQGDGGKIVHIASVGGLIGLGMEPDYCASKGAVVNLTRELAVDYSRDGINVNALCPGAFPTAMSSPAYHDKTGFEMTAAAHPIGRWGQVEEMAGPAVFLASDEASFVCGAIIPVDGGCVAQ